VDVVHKVIEQPISSWSYKAEALSTRHLGPVAQDFYAAFGFGEDDKHITTVDEGGAALAAIQGLNELLEEKMGGFQPWKRRYPPSKTYRKAGGLSSGMGRRIAALEKPIEAEQKTLIALSAAEKSER